MSATAVKERPILLKPHEVRAILAGRQSHLRRIVKPQPIAVEDGYVMWKGWGLDPNRFASDSRILRDCPYGKRGAILWAKETWAPRINSDGKPDERQQYVKYRADNSSDVSPHDDMDWHTWENHWRPSIHCPRWASRITLEIESVRVERLQEISDSDIAAEGFVTDETSHVVDTDDGSTNPRYVFMDLWEKLNGPGSWDSNPFVWAISFRRLEPCAS